MCFHQPLSSRVEYILLNSLHLSFVTLSADPWFASMVSLSDWISVEEILFFCMPPTPGPEISSLSYHFSSVVTTPQIKEESKPPKQIHAPLVP
jgi:hypothetical protein